MTNSNEKPTSIRIPFDLLEILRKLAKQHQRSLNGEILWAIRQYVKEQQQDQQQQEKEQQ